MWDLQQTQSNKQTWVERFPIRGFDFWSRIWFQRSAGICWRLGMPWKVSKVHAAIGPSDRRSRTRRRHPTPLWYYSMSWQFWRSNYKELPTSTQEIQPFKITSKNSPADLQQRRYHHRPRQQQLRTCWLGHWNLYLLGIRWAPHWRQYVCANPRAGSPNFCYQT